MSFVIGVDGGSTKCLMKATSINGELLAQVRGETTNHIILGAPVAGKLIAGLTERLLAQAGLDKSDCLCVTVGAAGIDSPADKRVVYDLYRSFWTGCPVFCMNDSGVALYGATKGVGISAISGTGSVVSGRNASGMVTRSGGHSTRIFGDEGSSRWMALWAMNYMSQRVDGSVPSSPLTEMIDGYFGGMDHDKMVEFDVGLKSEPVDPAIAVLVHEAAKQGDKAALDIIKNGAGALFAVARTCVVKLGFDVSGAFKSGVWGSVFVENGIYFEEYKRLFELNYPLCEVVFPDGDAADGAAGLAIDYLNGKAPFINDL